MLVKLLYIKIKIMFLVRQILTWPADKMDIRRQGVVYGVTAIQLGEAQSQIVLFGLPLEEQARGLARICSELTLHY